MFNVTTWISHETNQVQTMHESKSLVLNDVSYSTTID